MSIESLRRHLEQEMEFHRRMAIFYTRSGLASAAAQRNKEVAEREEWLRDLSGLNGFASELEADLVETTKQAPVIRYKEPPAKRTKGEKGKKR